MDMNGKVHNYYESRVFDEIHRKLAELRLSATEGEFDDIACIALNKLPPRYVRFDIDTTFYSTPEEIQMMDVAIKNAVELAIVKVIS